MPGDVLPVEALNGQDKLQGIHQLTMDAKQLKESGDITASLRISELVLNTRLELLGEAHPSVTQAMLDIADLHRTRGGVSMNLAEQWLKKVIDLKQRVRGNEHPEHANALFGLAVLYDERRQYDKALPLLRRAAAIQRIALGPDSPEAVATDGHLQGLLEKLSPHEQIRAYSIGAEARAAGTGEGAEWSRTMRQNVPPKKVDVHSNQVILG